MLKLIYSTSLIAIFSLLVGCSGGSDSEPAKLDDPVTVNAAPFIDPIADQTVLFGETAFLSATVTDDGLPGNTLNPRWRFESGPQDAGAPTFDKTDAMAVQVSFSAPGVYRFSFRVDDGEFEVHAEMQVDVQAYALSTFNSGLEVSMPANYLPSHSYDANWVNRVWEGVADCMVGEHAWDKATAEQRRTQLRRINVYKEQDYDPDIHSNSGDPDTWTSISVVAAGLMPSEEGYQGRHLAEEMVDYLLVFGARPVDGNLICGYNHAGRRHAVDTVVPSVDPHVVTQNLQFDSLNVVVQAEELKSSTINQLVQIAEYLTRIEGSDQHTPLDELRIVEDIRSVADVELWSSRGGFSVKESLLVLDRDLLEEDLFTARNYAYPGYWIDSYRQAYEDYYWDAEHREVDNMSCCLPFNE